VPHTLSDDGDPIDVLVCNTRPLIPGCVINVRPVGVMLMEDNSGQDEKIIAVPSTALTQRYDSVNDYDDLPEITLKQIEHFFEHYKDLEPGKWVKIGGWRDASSCRAEADLVEAIDRAKAKGLDRLVSPDMTLTAVLPIFRCLAMSFSTARLALLFSATARTRALSRTTPAASSTRPSIRSTEAAGVNRTDRSIHLSPSLYQLLRRTSARSRSR
jgi:hypothetical protein